MRRLTGVWVLVLGLNWHGMVTATGASFRVATYNLEGYLDEPTQNRQAKSAESRAQVRACIQAMAPDVLALQEMGSLAALHELRDSLSKEGLEFPFWEYIYGHDTNLHLAVLSRFPIVARRPHTNETFVLGRRRLQVSRGFGEVDIQVGPRYCFTLVNAHLKSKLSSAGADEAEWRWEEARLLREKIERRLEAEPGANLIVLGDFNDTVNSSPLKLVLGHGKNRLFDTRPEEEKGRTSNREGKKARKVCWTHFYPKEDSYTRIDYVLLSPGMEREWLPSETYIPEMANWGLASDHRPLVAGFEAEDK